MSKTRSNDTIRARAFLLLALRFGGVSALAQAPEVSAPQPEAKQRPSRRFNIDARVDTWAKSLDLTTEQQSAVRNIVQQRQQQTLLIRRDPSISGSTRIERFRMLQEATVERIRTVLNDEQKRKYDPMASRRMRSKPEHSVEDWLEASTPK